jgi:hypothetical protein
LHLAGGFRSLRGGLKFHHMVIIARLLPGDGAAKNRA